MRTRDTHHSRNGKAVFRAFGATMGLLLALFATTDANAAEPGACPRVVSQAPYITDTLAWLGMADCIVGVSSYDARKDLPQTGGIANPDYAVIAALRPHVVFLPDRGVEGAPARPLSSAWSGQGLQHVRVVRIFGFRTVDQIVANVYTIASAVGVANAAERRDEVRRLFDEKFAALSAKKRVSGNVAVLMDCTKPAAIIGRESFINDALSRAGFAVTSVEKTFVIREGDIVGQLRRYWDDNQIAAVILLSDSIKPNCVRSTHARQIPLYPVGNRTLSSSSPTKLLSDLDAVMDVIDRASEVQTQSMSAGMQ